MWRCRRRPPAAAAPTSYGQEVHAPAPASPLSLSQQVLLHLDGSFVCTAAAGNCSSCCFLPIARLTPGAHELLAELADAEGNIVATGSSRFRIIDAY